MNFKQLEAFVKVAEEGSFSKAAGELFLTQPTVSSHISALEKELNARLFVRNTKEVSLSESGKLLYQYAREMIDLEQRIKELFLTETRNDMHCITIATSTVPAQYLLPEILAKFREEYPEEQFRIVETDSAGVVEKIIDRTVEIGFTGTVLEKMHCRYIPIYQDDLIVITPNTEKYRKIKREERSLAWVEREHVIMREEGSGTRKEVEKQLKKEGIDVNRLNVVANIENPGAIKKSVKAGIGITMISRLAAQDEIETGDVLEFPLSDTGEGRNLNLVYNKNYPLSQSAERFVKVVKEIYPPIKKEV